MKRLLRSSSPTLADSLLLGLTFAAGIFLSLHGKALAEVLLNRNQTSFFREADNNVYVYLPLIVSGAAMLTLRHFRMSSRRVALYCSLASAIGAIVSSTLSEDAESSVLFLKIFMFGSLTVVVYLERFFDRELGVEFWKTVTDSVAKGVRYIIALFIGGFAVLKFVSEGIHESKDGFMTTLVYPCLIMLIAFFMWGIWLFLPAWERLVSAFEQAERSDVTKRPELLSADEKNPPTRRSRKRRRR